MSVEISDVRVGDPVRCGALAVFPLYAERTLFPDETIEYLLSDEAQQAGTCTVREVSPVGVVGELMVKNSGDLPVLFLEGEELRGAKQNRVMQSTVLVAPQSRTVVPVYCIERGRWDRSPTSLKTGAHAPPSLRHLLKGGDGRFRCGGQAAVWRYVAAKHSSTGTHSPQQNMTDALRSRPEVVDSLRNELRYPEGASGVVVLMRGRTVGIDVFDKPSTLSKVWHRLVVLGLTLDALDMRADEAVGSDLAAALYVLRNLRWRLVETVGLGEAFIARDDDGALATSLVVDGVPVHLSVSMPTGS